MNKKNKFFSKKVLTNSKLFVIILKHHKCGEMSERFKELVLKTSDSKEPRVRISVSPPIFFYIRKIFRLWRSTQAGRRGAPAKGVGRVTVARVQIPPSPPIIQYSSLRDRSIEQSEMRTLFRFKLSNVLFFYACFFVL